MYIKSLDDKLYIIVESLEEKQTLIGFGVRNNRILDNIELKYLLDMKSCE